MRSPKRRRPRRREIFVPEGVDLNAVAVRVRYVGSPEHKDTITSAGMSRPRPDASICPRPTNDMDRATGWLQSAIRSGWTGDRWEGGFPRYVWHKHRDTVFEARLINRGNGTYKGYPLSDHEWPLSFVTQA